MRNIRLIARLDIKAPNLVKGIQLEGLRKMGDPNEFALKYYLQGADEIFYADIVASLYERNSLLDIIEKTTDNVFVPITVGGGLRSIGDVSAALRAGADKVIIGSEAFQNPEFIEKGSERFGNQCITVSIDYKKNSNSEEEVFVVNGQQPTGWYPIEWSKKVETLGAGEILLYSIDRDGSRQGYDLEVLQQVSEAVKIPVIACGGVGQSQHIKDGFEMGSVSGVAAGSFFVFQGHQRSVLISYNKDYAN